MRTLFVFLVLFFTSVSVFAEDLALDWKPEPEFGGFYEAQKLKRYDKSWSKN